MPQYLSTSYFTASTFGKNLYFKMIYIVLFTVAFSGCLPKQPPLRIDYYTLDYEPPKAAMAPQLPAIIAIERFSSSPEYLTDKMLYQEDQAKLSSYTYHRWRAMPADIVSYFLTRDLKAMKSFQAVTAPTGHLQPTHRLEGIVDKFLEIDTNAYWQAVISVTVTLIKESEPDVSKQVLAQQSFTATIRSKSKHPQSISQAMAIGMADISKQINTLLVEKVQ